MKLLVCVYYYIPINKCCNQSPYHKHWIEYVCQYDIRYQVSPEYRATGAYKGEYIKCFQSKEEQLYKVFQRNTHNHPND